MATFKVEKVGVSNIGRNKTPKIEIDRRYAQAQPAHIVHGGNSRPSYAGEVYVPQPHSREKPRVVGRDDFNDEIPFGRRAS